MGRHWVNPYSKWLDGECSNSSSVSDSVDLWFWPAAAWFWGRSSRLGLFDAVSLSNFLPVAITTKMLRLQEIFGTVGIDCDHLISSSLHNSRGSFSNHPGRRCSGKKAIPPDKEACQQLSYWKPKHGLAIISWQNIPYHEILHCEPHHQILHVLLHKSIFGLVASLFVLKLYVQWFDLFFLGRLKAHILARV